MTYSQVHTIVMEVLDEVQTSVAETPVVITDQTRPFGEMQMFDSILAEDTTVTVLKRLGVTDVAEPNNPFIVDGSGVCVGDVARAFGDLIGATEA